MRVRIGVALIVCALMARAPALPAAQVSVVPLPSHVEQLEGTFAIDAGTPVRASSQDALWVAQEFASLLERFGGPKLRPRVSGSVPGPAIRFTRAPETRSAGPESYTLDITPAGASIRASDRRGLFYGAMTLLQMLGAGGADGQPAARSVSAMRIVDRPRFAWRGVLLDSARHYQSPQFIEHFIDSMAILKLNVLHWHLTDDQGWRLEIRKYPRLTQVGAWRVPAGRAPLRDIDAATGKPRLYGGYYSQDTVRRLVTYAQLRGITIVPEIDVPGHASAAIAAYPELAVAPASVTSVPADWGVYPNLFSPEESTFRFLTAVLDEVIGLFPGRYVHLGGDEAVKDQWRASAPVQARMKMLGLRDEAALQSYFIARLGRYLDAHGRRLVGWDEILEGGLPSDAVVMSWRGVDGARKAAAAAHDTVLSPAPTLYLDNRQSTSSQDPPGRGFVVPLEAVYGFDPVPANASAADLEHILGVQANAWTEHMRTEERVAFMTFPRAAAVAEIGWSPRDPRDFPAFLRRWIPQARLLQTLGIKPAASAFEVSAHVTHPVPLVSETTPLQVTLASQTKFGDVRFTLDGSDPRASSPTYTAPLSLQPGASLRAASFEGTKTISPVATFALDAPHLDTLDSRELRGCTDKLTLALEDDAPVAGPRAVFLADVLNPCWIYPDVDLSHGATVTASVGQVPFNFQIGADAKRIPLPAPATPDGELEIRAGCEGERIAVLPLAAAAGNDGVTALPAARLDAQPRHADLCFTFTRKSLEPMWVLERVRVDAVGR